MNPRPLALLPYPGAYALRKAPRQRRRWLEWTCICLAISIASFALVRLPESARDPNHELQSHYRDPRHPDQRSTPSAVLTKGHAQLAATLVVDKDFAQPKGASAPVFYVKRTGR